MTALVRAVIAFSRQRRVHGVGVFINIDKDRCGAAICDGFARGHKRAGHRDNFVAGSDAESQKGQPEGFRAIADANRVLAIAECRKIFFESCDKGSSGESAAIDDFRDRSIELVAQRCVLGVKIEKRDFQFHSLLLDRSEFWQDFRRP